MVKRKKVDFRLEAINVLYGLHDNAIGHVIVKNPTEQDIFDDPLADQGDERLQDLLQDSLCDLLAFIGDTCKESENTTLTLVVLSNKNILEKAIDDPLQKRKQVDSEDASKTRQPSPPKQSPKPTMQDTKQKEAIRDDDDDDEYYFKFINENVSQPLRYGFEDVFQCQANLQETQLQNQKPLQDLELKPDSQCICHQA
ncbi:hypothetical protein E5676_scaffold2208G00350 [Cucumis melo var. makuwa]|nr:hypothetical protein E5676_scaffold2208G00350 [Cucumis melo var. makuwa]